MKFDIIIFDDGLQEKWIDYDIKFVCFDSEKWIGNGHLIPSGPLREKIENLKNYHGLFLKIVNEDSNLDFIYNTIRDINPNLQRLSATQITPNQTYGGGGTTGGGTAAYGSSYANAGATNNMTGFAQAQGGRFYRTMNAYNINENTWYT